MRFLKPTTDDPMMSAADSAMGEEDLGDSEAMMEEQPELMRSDSIFMRRFDPEYMIPLEISRSVSMVQNQGMGMNQPERSEKDDFNDFYKYQQEFSNQRQLENRDNNDQMMMEELPGRKQSIGEEFMDIGTPTLQNKFSFLGGDEKEQYSFGINPEYYNLFGLEKKKTSEFPQETSPLKLQFINPQNLPHPYIKQAQDEIFSHNGERGGKVPFDVSKSRPICNCTKSQCLKLYCACFREGLVCSQKCKCTHCMNTIVNKDEVMKRRNQKIIRLKEEKDETFCNCRMSFCEKSYCICARNEKGCSSMCKCFHCKNKFGAKDKDKNY